jgi:Cu/Ag efflux pump CusA
MVRKRREFKEEILLDSPLKIQISQELKTSVQTVREALKYNNNSPLGKSIRRKAKELLIEEANKIQDYE